MSAAPPRNTPTPSARLSSSSTMDANYVAVLSSSVCAIHNWTDGINILQRVMSVDICSIVVTRCFKTQNDALCWLTDPVQSEAVACSAERKTFAGELASFDS